MNHDGDRVIWKFIEKKFSKFKHYIILFEDYMQPLSEYDLRQFQTAEDVSYLRQDYPQFDLLVTLSMITLWLCKSKLTEEIKTYSFKSKL